MKPSLNTYADQWVETLKPDAEFTAKNFCVWVNAHSEKPTRNAVRNVFRRLLEDRRIVVTTRGKGKRATTYSKTDDLERRLALCRTALESITHDMGTSQNIHNLCAETLKQTAPKS